MVEIDLDRLPEHLNLVLEHQPHAPAQLAAGCEIAAVSAIKGVIEIEPRYWVSPEQMAKAVETGSIWTARWLLPDCSSVELRAAADLGALVEAIGSVAAPKTISATFQRTAP